MHQYQPDQDHRRAVLQAVLLLCAIGSLGFAALNFPDEMFLVAGIQLGLAAFSLGLLVMVRRGEPVQSCSLCFLLVWLSALMVFVGRPEVSAFAFVWLLIIPILAHLLLGPRLGLLLSLGYMGVGGAIYLHRFRGDPELVSIELLANAVIAALTILALSHFYERSRERFMLKLIQLATVDPLTGLANRMRLKEVFDHERARAQRAGTPLSLLMLDLDRFKRINDDYGHEAGDAVLVAFAQLLRDRLRKTDLIARFGGEEFLVALPDTDAQVAIAVAEELRGALESLAIPYQGKRLQLTVSIGVAEYGRDGVDLDTLSRIADERLYQAKAAGRNRVRGGAAAAAPTTAEAACATG